MERRVDLDVIGVLEGSDKSSSYRNAADYFRHYESLFAPFRKADINIIDWERLTLRPPTVAYDLPSGGRRLTQDAEGYVATIVNGTVVYLDGQPTGQLPGRLVRGQQAAPAL